ncbi:MAG TPA: RNase adapter RapZ [Xanthomonadales bacterium]|nr:RNase adapter RapZ [Xanthomonadales bacterium]
MGKLTTSHLILVSGLSGSGKSTALGALEDLGYYCADNLPATLLAEFANHVRSDPDLYRRVALGVDARSHGPALAGIPGWMDSLISEGVNCEMVFLTAEPSVLLQRFSETRRRHPLTTDTDSLPAAIAKEQTLLETLRKRSDWVMNTSQTNIHQLRRQIWKWAGEQGDDMTLVLQSFAFKLGVPQDADFLFDARCLPNPHWEEELRPQTGQDPGVKQWLEKDQVVEQMYRDIRAFLSEWLPRFENAQRSYVTVGIGCTGGRHRSVYLVERLRHSFSADYSQVVINHRDLPS